MEDGRRRPEAADLSGEQAAGENAPAQIMCDVRQGVDYDRAMITEDDIRMIALSLPSTTEKPSYGSPGFRVDDKLFARVREEGDLLIFVADVGEKRVLLESEPDKFFTTALYDGYASVLVRLSAVDVDELAELLTEAWRVRAPRALLEAFDAEHD